MSSVLARLPPPPPVSWACRSLPWPKAIRPRVSWRQSSRCEAFNYEWSKIMTQSSDSLNPGFPTAQPRRLRQTPALRRLVRETRLSPADFIYPLFIVHGQEIQREISSMPGVYQQSVDTLAREADELQSLKIPAVILFDLPASKDPIGLENIAENGIVQQAIQALRAAAPNLIVMTDVCMCEYTDHGHCGIVEEGRILNEPTIEILGRVAISHARAGAHVVAP